MCIIKFPFIKYVFILMWVEVNIIIEKGAGWIDVDRAE